MDRKKFITSGLILSIALKSCITKNEKNKSQTQSTDNMANNKYSLMKVGIGPLVVSKKNSHYFAVAGGDENKVIYLTGAHINNNFHDGGGAGAECAGGDYSIEWYSINSRETQKADKLTAQKSGKINFKAPFKAASSALLYLKKVKN